MSYKQMCFKSTPATQTLLNPEGRILCGKMKSKFDQLALLKKKTTTNNKHIKYIDDDFIT